MLQGLSHCVTSPAHLLALQTVNEMLWREMIIQPSGVMPGVTLRPALHLVMVSRMKYTVSDTAQLRHQCSWVNKQLTCGQMERKSDTLDSDSKFCYVQLLTVPMSVTANISVLSQYVNSRSECKRLTPCQQNVLTAKLSAT